MNQAPDPNGTIDVPADSLEAGLAAAYGRPAAGPVSVLSELRPSLGEIRPVLLREAEGESAHVVKPRSDAMPDSRQAGDRYQLAGEIARGGMGAVLRGRDVDLGRDLAIKVLLDKYAHQPETVRRFLEEAQIGGQLQHPGVVPVYDMGRFGKQPFFTMKLVKGQTLAALLSERTDPAAERPRLLSIALDVAQTLAYAHAKGVIHRDLKPANVMVGAFGEVLVMDWGLAKVLPAGGIADEEQASRAHQRLDVTTIRTARSSGSAGRAGTDTEAGSLLGTPAYMPPEQANGDVALLDRRADVFGLGAILCEILTGKPPYVGRSYEEVRRKAANGDLGDALARLDACGADEELVALTRACLAAEALDRPRDAQAVVDALSAYLDGVQERLREAELAEAAARAQAAEEAKRRRLTLALAATMLLAVTLGGSGWWWLTQEREARQAELAREVNEALNQATVLREQAKAATVGNAALFSQAREQAQRALALVESGPADETLKRRVTQLQSELDEEEKDRKLLAALDAARLAQAETLSESRFAVERAVPRFREAFRAYGLPVGEGEPEAAVRRIRQRPGAVREAIVAALDEWDELADKPNAGVTRPQREWLQAVLAAAQPQNAWTRQVRAARAEKDDGRRRAAFAKLAASADVAKVPGRALTRLAKRLDSAAAVALLRRAQVHYPADFWVNENLGMVLEKTTPPAWDEAVRFLTAAVALRSDSPGAIVNLGRALQGRGDFDEAIACSKKAIALDPKYAAAHNNLGAALAGKHRLDEAIACYKEALALDPKYALAHNNLGAALADKGQVDEAIACYKTAIALNPRYAAAHHNMGYALARKGQLDEAIACYKQAITLDPKFALAHNNLGNVLKDKGQVDEAIACYKKAIALDPKYASPHNNLGNMLRAKGRLDEAIACYKKAIALDPKDAWPHNNLGVALKDKRQVDEAIACYKKAIALDPKLAYAPHNLGIALAGKGQVDEAIACFKKAIALDPKYASPHVSLGIALAGKGQVDEAIACFKKAIALDSKFAPVHNKLGIALAGKGRLDEAIACFKKAIALDPKYARAHNNLGNALAGKGQVDEAIACFKKAIALDSKFAPVHNKLGIALAGKGQVDEAIACYKKAIALDPKDADAHLNFADVLTNAADPKRRDPIEAVALARKATELKPQLWVGWCNLGEAYYRTGQWPQALAALDKGRALLKSDNGEIFFFLAMAHQRAGHQDQAQAWYDKGIAWMDQHAPQDPTLLRYRSEAASVLGRK